MGLFKTFDTENLLSIFRAVRDNTLRIEGLPSWPDDIEMSTFVPIRTELNALVVVDRELLSNANAVSWHEALALTAWAGGTVRDSTTPTEGISWREGNLFGGTA